MHPQNPHRGAYDFDILQTKNPGLAPFVFQNEHQTKTINFADPNALFQLNRALLLHHYSLQDYVLPSGVLCPAVPGRADYICHLKSLLDEIGSSQKNTESIRVLDVGVGANVIYPIIGANLFGWNFVGVDINRASVESAKRIIEKNDLHDLIEIRHQQDNANILVDAIRKDEFFDATLCNPPFFKSESEAAQATRRKLKGLGSDIKAPLQNFGGKANELWCNGGEALFIKRMIKQSKGYKKQVGVFTTLVSRSQNLEALQKQLAKAKAKHRTMMMTIGNKQSRVLAWWF